MEAAEKYMLAEYNAKRIGEWIVCGEWGIMAKFHAGHNVMLATFNAAMSILSVYRFEAGYYIDAKGKR